MNEQEIIEGKNLVAKFMGGRYVRYEYLSYEPKGCWEGIALHSYASTHPQTYDLKYNSSWDWLMPVVIKMANTPEYQNYFSQEKLYFEGNPLMAFATSYKFDVNLTLESVFEEVVGFIKWYNTL